MRKIAAYCRVSTDSEMQLLSLKNQRDFFEDFAQKNNYELVKIYADKGISGKQMSMRPQFLNLLSDSKKHMFDLVVTKDISRFARNTLDFLCGIRELKKNGVDIWFLSNNKTILGESEFILTIYAALAQQESENLSKRISFGKMQSAKNGRTPSVIYGYDKNGTFSLDVNDFEADCIRLIFYLYTERYYGFKKISDTLNFLEIPSKKNCKWNAKSVSRILKNPVYCGILINNKTTTLDFISSIRTKTNESYIHKNASFKIIDKKIFDKAKRIINGKSLENQKHAYRSHHIFSSVIFCKNCAHPFTKQKNSYRCSLNNQNKEKCSNSFAISEKKLLDFFEDYFKSFDICKKKQTLSKNDEKIVDFLKRIKYVFFEKHKNLSLSKSDYEGKILKTDEIMPTCRNDYLHSNEFYIDFLKKIEVDNNGNIFIYI